MKTIMVNDGVIRFIAHSFALGKGHRFAQINTHPSGIACFYESEDNPNETDVVTTPGNIYRAVCNCKTFRKAMRDWRRHYGS